MLCGEKTWTYYTDTSFTNAVTGALTDKQAEAVGTGFFKPTTLNSDGKPRATLVGYKFMRTKLGGSKPGMVGYEEMTGKKTSNLNWDYFKEKGSYLKLHVYGDCKVTITGGAAAAADYRGVWVYDSNGEEVAEISNTTELTERSFDASLNDEFYIVGNSGGVTAIDCESENEDEEIGEVDDDAIYSEKIDGVTISSDSGTELLKSASATLTATVEAVHAKEDALSYSWSISQGSEYASLSSASDATTKITMSDSALEEEVVTVSCTVSYNFGECNTITSSIDITVGQSGTVNAHFDMLCGETTWTYYTDSSFTNAVTGALTDKQAEAVETGYFKPTTLNSDGKPRATLVGYKFMRKKVGNSNPGMVGYDEMTGKKTSNLNWEYFKEKGSYLKLHVYGDCKITITGAGASATAEAFRGVWVYDSNGEEVAEISNTTELTERSFDAALNDEFYIVGNSGGVTAIDCESVEEAVDSLWDFSNATCQQYTTDGGSSYTMLGSSETELSNVVFKSVRASDISADGLEATLSMTGKASISGNCLTGSKVNKENSMKYGGSIPYCKLVLNAKANVTIEGTTQNTTDVFRVISISSAWGSSSAVFTEVGGDIIAFESANTSVSITKTLEAGTYYIGFNGSKIASIKAITE